MSSKKSAQTLRLKILPSRQLALFLLLTHAGAIMIVSQLVMPFEVVMGITTIIVISFYNSLRRYIGLKSRDSIVEAVWESDGEWVLLTANGEALDVELLPTSTIFSILVLLNFRLHARRASRTLVLASDSLDSKTFRNLRIRLHLEPPK